MAANNPSVAISATEFAQWMDACVAPTSHPHFAVAVSGGADSLALLFLTDIYARAAGGHVSALTVDHGLRAESAAEASQVATWCAARAIDHHTLRWDTPAPVSAIQASAREARYRLMTSWCETHQVPYLLTAHHQGDQTETLFFRLARGSGLDGLACMQPVKTLSDKVSLLRPLLSIPKSRLMATLRAQNHPWIEDPSNQNPHYTRSRIRAAIEASGDADAISQRAYALTQSFTKIRNLLENKLAGKLTECLSGDKDSPILDHEQFKKLAPEYGLRLLAHLIQQLGGHEHKPRTEKLQRLYLQLTQGDFRHPLSLGGCVFALPVEGKIHVQFCPPVAS